MTLKLNDNELDVLIDALHDYKAWNKSQLDFQTPLNSTRATQLVTNELSEKVEARLSH